ncbi:hypothetical protein FOC1_g10001870 [Fusarium oxysporum f. sp. cubense race 1]|uniref:Uncharacterized protein n=1 Tax=Fusarium oxysporum f. sp. cubense (strain race 1) TaxID=1229664 RepID=N4UVT4_FUSC1|nr:hypothetical protein FOC1_g10001870 [Fusarium oxysporum f. sp. cubense race 1]
MGRGLPHLSGPSAPTPDEPLTGPKGPQTTNGPLGFVSRVLSQSPITETTGKKLEKETGAAKLRAPRMKMDKETMKRENMPNGDEADNSMDDAIRNAAKQRPELPSEMPQLGGTQQEEDNETTAKLFRTPSSSPSSSPRRFFTPSGKYAQKRLAEYQSLRAEARRKITEEDRARMEAGMIEQAVAESLKITTVTQACTFAQNTDQPKPLSSLKEPLPHDEKDNDSSPPSQEATSPDGSEDPYEGAWLDKLPPEELVYDGTTSAFSNGFP